MRLVLASGSPRRADVLAQLGLTAEVVRGSVDEAYLDGETPAGYVERLARAKAEAVAADVEADLVIGADTVVLDGGRVLGKPRDEADAAATLVSLSGGTHEVLSGLALVGAHGTVSGLGRATVRFRAYGEEVARRYAATGEPLDKAGGYGIQGLGAALVEGLEGDYYCVVGFPLGVFLDLLVRVGWRYDFGSLTPTSD